MNHLVRPHSGRIVAGVCQAVANRYGWNVTAVRFAVLLAVVFAGLSIWAYVLLWVVIPSES